MEQSGDYSDQTQRFNINEGYQTMSDEYNENAIQNWQDLYGENSNINNPYQQEIPQLDANTNRTTSYGFEQQEDPYQYNPTNAPTEDINNEIDYETLIRSKHLYYDPNPEVIRKPSTITNPLVYNQNIMIRFLQPPPVTQEPLIIREVRPPQPPPLPPLIIRQRAAPPLSPPPLILRERPPPIPPIMTAKVITKPLPPVPPPPRSVVIEKLPPLPPRPRDVIIERWIPYESVHKRKVIVQRADEPQPYPQPRNVIITYEPVQAKVVRHFERLGVTPTDPHQYLSTYGNSLLNTEQLLAQARDLGILEDLSPPNLLNPHQQTTLNVDEQNYAATYENLILSANKQPTRQNSPARGEDLSAQFAQYGMTADSIPY